MMLPKSKMKLYLELGFNDNRQNFWDLVVQPDHAMATILGFQKYGINNNKGIPSNKDVSKILDYAFKKGICTVDTAHSYGNSQKKLGKCKIRNRL